jgi:hypothetical protein
MPGGRWSRLGCANTAKLNDRCTRATRIEGILAVNRQAAEIPFTCWHVALPKVAKHPASTGWLTEPFSQFVWLGAAKFNGDQTVRSTSQGKVIIRGVFGLLATRGPPSLEIDEREEALEAAADDRAVRNRSRTDCP